MNARKGGARVERNERAGFVAEMLARAEEALEEGAELLEADEVYAWARAELAAARERR